MLGVSQANLANKLGYSPHRLHNALASDNIKTGLLEDIARALGKNIGWFYGEDVSPEALDDLSDIQSYLTESYYILSKSLKKIEDRNKD